MKAVNISFPDKTHGKFPVSASTTFEQLLDKAVKKRNLSLETHELFLNNERVDLSKTVEFDKVASAKLEVREVGANLRLSAQHPLYKDGKSARGTITKKESKLGEVCTFCGSELQEGENDAQLEGQKYHMSCFKCSMCFETLKSGDKVFSHLGKPACEVCFVGLHGQKLCMRCGESVRGCFVVPVEGKGDVHVECMTCCLCHASLVTEGHTEKDGELLCLNHKSLRPIKDPNFKRPKKIGNWKAGELALVRVKTSNGFKWNQGIIRKVANFAADVELDDNITLSVPVTDLLVTHRAVEVSKDKMNKEFRKGKVVAASEVHFLQRDNSLAQFVRVTSAPRTLKPGPAAVSPRKAQEKKVVAAAAAVKKADEKEKPAEVEDEQTAADEQFNEDFVPEEAPKRPGLRFSDNEEVFAHINEEWIPGVIVTGDADVEDGPYYLV